MCISMNQSSDFVLHVCLFTVTGFFFTRAVFLQVTAFQFQGQGSMVRNMYHHYYVGMQITLSLALLSNSSPPHQNADRKLKLKSSHTERTLTRDAPNIRPPKIFFGLLGHFRPNIFGG